jgi:hypothetical protein
MIQILIFVVKELLKTFLIYTIQIHLYKEMITFINLGFVFLNVHQLLQLILHTKFNVMQHK